MTKNLTTTPMTQSSNSNKIQEKLDNLIQSWLELVNHLRHQ